MSACYSLGTSVVLLAVGVFLDRLGMWFWPKIVEKWEKRGK